MAEMRNTEVVIIGAGPAGATCAFLLQQAGVDCVLVDQAAFPREKVCGGGLTVKAYRLLAELMPALHYDYQSVRRLRLMLDDREICEFEPAAELRVVNRKDFDYALLQQYLGLGGAFVQDAFAKYELLPDGAVLVSLRSGEQLRCKYLVGADGANSHVRRQMLGEYRGNTLFLEQYVPKGADAIEGVVSRSYAAGYYYRFPGVGHDVVGFGDRHASVERFREILAEKGIAETKIKGAFIPTEEVVSDSDRIILIGDAGGFVNKLTYEGLYYAFATARNAARAILEGVPFKETNRLIFRKKRSERWKAWLFYSGAGRLFLRCGSRISTRLIKRFYDRGVRDARSDGKWRRMERIF